MNPLYPCSKPCSTRTHNDTGKKLTLYSTIINGITMEYHGFIPRITIAPQHPYSAMSQYQGAWPGTQSWTLGLLGSRDSICLVCLVSRLAPSLFRDTSALRNIVTSAGAYLEQIYLVSFIRTLFWDVNFLVFR